jgi:hypothetical protein
MLVGRVGTSRSPKNRPLASGFLTRSPHGRVHPSFGLGAAIEYLRLQQGVQVADFLHLSTCNPVMAVVVFFTHERVPVEFPSGYARECQFP